MEKEFLKLKKYFSRILNSNIEDYYSLYKKEDENYENNVIESNWLKLLASDGLDTIEKLEKLFKELKPNNGEAN